MADIYITGHRNPDTDSVCSAYCYSILKNKIDPENHYIPIRCGRMNNQTKEIFRKFDIAPPRLIKDIAPQVGDIAKRDVPIMDMNAPVLSAIRKLDEENLSVIPVFENDTDFKGIISLHEISGFLISENRDTRPIYAFRINNLQQVLPGYFYRRGKEQEFKAPILTGAMPFESSVARINAMLPHKPVLVIGLREKLLNFALKEQFPAIILTGIDHDEKLSLDISGYKGTIFISRMDTAETIRLLRLSSPLKNVMNTKSMTMEGSQDFDEAKDILVNSSLRGLPVMEDGQFAGIVTRRCFIEKPKKKLILVDHNELAQSIPGAEQAEIVEIIDHHRLGNSRTRQPIYVYARPVGSTCTIVYTHFLLNAVEISPSTAALLASGILSDTVLLKSPTTSPVDRNALRELLKLARMDFDTFAEILFSQNVSLRESEPDEVVNGDFKIYREGTAIGISQVEVVTLEDAEQVKEQYLKALEGVKKEQGLDWVMLLVTDVIKVRSILFMTDYHEGEEKLLYKKISPGLYDLPGILSRKKQLLPEILRVLEEMQNQNLLSQEE